MGTPEQLMVPSDDFTGNKDQLEVHIKWFTTPVHTLTGASNILKTALLQGSRDEVLLLGELPLFKKFSLTFSTTCI